jgi:hypothetical protein
MNCVTVAAESKLAVRSQDRLMGNLQDPIDGMGARHAIGY